MNIPKCPVCQTPTPAKAIYCSDAHRLAHHNRRRLEGAKIRDLALYWRSSRSKEALSALCFVVDGLLAAERASGLPKPSRPALVRAKVHTALGKDKMPKQRMVK